MKNLISKTSIILLLSVALFSCKERHADQKEDSEISTYVVSNPLSAAEKTNSSETAVFSFTEKSFDFGTVAEGEKVSYAFKFKNTGKAELVIASASGSCGCTVPEYPKKPIGPGEEGVINVVFDSEGKQGKQNKTVTLVANTIPNEVTLTIMGDVIASADKPKNN
jgi:hypothetical protein